MRRARSLLACSLAALAVVLGGCFDGSADELGPPKSEANLRNGAELFHERCGGCHTLGAADARGSKPSGSVAAGERTNGPNFDVRKENREDVLFAIRNGGFSGAIMPANIVAGQDAEDVALFLERYAGSRSGAQGGVQNAVPQNR
jgi:mono/diheme cytochrome c family protein